MNLLWSNPSRLSVILLVAASCGCGDGGGGLAIASTDATLSDTLEDVSEVDTIAPDDSAVAMDTALAVDTVAADTQSPPDMVSSQDTSAPPATLGGGILLSQIDSSVFNLAVAAARFTDPVAQDQSGTVHGPCRVQNTSPSGNASPIYGYDAGVITVNSSPLVTLTPNAEGALGTGYSSSLPDNAERLLGPGGALLSISGAGGAEVGAFSMVIQLPEPVTLTAPATGFNASYDVDNSLTVNWNVGTGETVLVTVSPLSSTAQPESGPTAICLLDGDSGTLTIPASALAGVLDGAQSQNAALGVTRSRTSSAMSDGIKVPATATRSTGGLIQLEK